MRVEDVLRDKGHEVHTIGLGVSLHEAAGVMLDRNIGALLCVDGSGGIIGILSERDLTRSMAMHGHEAIDRTVSQCMNRDVIACRADDEVGNLLSIMTETRCRHLPVVQEGQVIGLVSIGDLIKAEHRI